MNCKTNLLAKRGPRLTIQQGSRKGFAGMKHTKTVSVRLADEVRTTLGNHAANRNESISEIIRRALERALNNPATTAAE
jgi:predicted HicB family RNase H-like nuclease